MRLRSRLQNELKARLAATLPEAVTSTWDHDPVVVLIEQLKFKSAGGLRNDWAFSASFDGIARAELLASGIDDLIVEPLISDLVTEPIHLTFTPDAVPGQSSENARFILIDWRDVVREMQVASALRFQVSGDLGIYAGPNARPQIFASQAPDIGIGHEGDYQLVEGPS